MAVDFSPRQKQFIKWLRGITEVSVMRGAVAPPGYHAMDPADERMLRSIREFSFEEEIGEDKVELHKLLTPLSRPHKKGTLFVSDTFTQSLTELTHNHILLPDLQDNFAHRTLKKFFEQVFLYIHRDTPEPILGDSAVMHRRVEPEKLPDDKPETVVSPKADVPQIYYLPGLPGDTQVEHHPELMSNYNAVCQWARPHAPADVYFVEPIPYSGPGNFKENHDDCCASVRAFIKRFMLPLIAQKDGHGKWHAMKDLNQVKRNLSKQTLIGYCYGGQLQQEFENGMFDLMTSLDYSYEDLTAALSCIGMVSVANRPHPEYGKMIVPALSVCNKDDHIPLMARAHNFEEAQDVQEYNGVQHGWHGRLLHVESAKAPSHRFWKTRDGKIECMTDDKWHDFKSYTQLDEREFRKSDYRDLYRVHPCANLVRGTIGALVEASKQDIRDAGKIIEEQAKIHLQPDAIDASVAYVESNQKNLEPQATLKKHVIGNVHL